MIEGTGHIVAAGIRSDLEDANAGRALESRYTCPNCGQTSRHRFLADGWCDDCAGLEAAPSDPEHSRAARRQLHRDAALMLRRLGFPERAAIHDAEADRA